MEVERVVGLTALINLAIALINLQIAIKNNKKDTTPKE